jgi:hypothetical protein
MNKKERELTHYNVLKKHISILKFYLMMKQRIFTSYNSENLIFHKLNNTYIGVELIELKKEFSKSIINNRKQNSIIDKQKI